MKTYAVFKNKGEVDINAFKLLGASSKETDETKIGFWGSGLKYALAVLLRNGVEIKAFSGEKEIKISTRKTKMRGETYEVITINSSPTSITTRAGKDWELWFAIRELYANGLDEDDFELKVEQQLSGNKNETRLFVEMTDEIKNIFDNFEKYFSKKRKPKHRLGKDKIFTLLEPEKSGLIYRRGIKVGNQDKIMYDYDLHDIAINESRVIVSRFELEWKLVELWKTKANSQMIKEMTKSQDSFERTQLDWSYQAGVSFNEEWLIALQGTKIIPREVSGFYTDKMTGDYVILTEVLCKALYKQFGNKLYIYGMTPSGELYREREVTSEENMAINEAIELLQQKLETDFSIYQVKVAKMHDEGVLGTIDQEKNEIIISEDVFDMGKKMIASTLYEEYVHLKYGFEDHTRRMQNFLFKTIINLISK